MKMMGRTTTAKTQRRAASTPSSSSNAVRPLQHILLQKSDFGPLVLSTTVEEQVVESKTSTCLHGALGAVFQSSRFCKRLYQSASLKGHDRRPK